MRRYKVQQGALYELPTIRTKSYGDAFRVQEIQKDRAVRFPGYFFKSACQLRTTVTGVLPQHLHRPQARGPGIADGRAKA